LLPILTVAVATALRGRIGAAAAVLIGWSLWTGITGGLEPRLVHRDRDGTAPLFRAASGAEEWTRLLPGYVLQEPDRRRLAFVWAGALALAAVAAQRQRRVTALGLAASTVGLAGAAALASLVSDGRTRGRDAVRIVGRAALAVPGWSVSRQSNAEWLPTDLAWGPLYEPHRHPDGVELGSRLSLRPGAYRVTLALQDLAPGSAPPSLDLRSEGGPPARTFGWSRGAGCLQSSFDVTAADRAVTLVLRGGGPFLLERIILAVQPSGAPPV
jgi:hypothetical protein